MIVRALRSRIVPGIVLSAALALSASAVDAATVHGWRFEDAPAPLGDSIGSAALTAAGNAQTVALPPTGRGGDFPTGFLPGDANQKAAELDGAGDLLSATVAPLSGDFTIECFAHADELVGGVGDILVALGATTPAPFTFGLQIRADGLGGTQPRELMLFVGAPGGLTFAALTSGIVLETGKDYYIAASFDLGGTSQGTFYVQNLTDAGPLQVVTKPHTLVAVEQSSLLTIGGLGTTPNTAFDGLIDEVRLSSHVLPPSELLINQATQIPALPAPALVLLALALGTASVWRARAS